MYIFYDLYQFFTMSHFLEHQFEDDCLLGYNAL
jgi:hypothetical protein